MRLARIPRRGEPSTWNPDAQQRPQDRTVGSADRSRRSSTALLLSPAFIGLSPERLTVATLICGRVQLVRMDAPPTRPSRVCVEGCTVMPSTMLRHEDTYIGSMSNASKTAFFCGGRGAVLRRPRPRRPAVMRQFLRSPIAHGRIVASKHCAARHRPACTRCDCARFGRPLPAIPVSPSHPAILPLRSPDRGRVGVMSASRSPRSCRADSLERAEDALSAIVPYRFLTAGLYAKPRRRSR